MVSSPAVAKADKSAGVSAPVPVAPGVVQQTQGKNTLTSTAQVLNPNTGQTLKLNNVPDLPMYSSNDFGSTKEVVKVQDRSNWSQAKKVQITTVVDGDGAKGNYKDGSGEVICRVTGIDAPETEKAWKRKPEPGQKYGEFSKKTLQEMIENREVSVQVSLDPKDKRGPSMKNRDLCLITIEGKNVSTAMVEAGAAYVYDTFVKPEMRGELTAAEAKAKKEKAGIHASPNEEKPWDYRQRMKLQ